MSVLVKICCKNKTTCLVQVALLRVAELDTLTAVSAAIAALVTDDAQGKRALASAAGLHALTSLLLRGPSAVASVVEARSVLQAILAATSSAHLQHLAIGSLPVKLSLGSQAIVRQALSVAGGLMTPVMHALGSPASPGVPHGPSLTCRAFWPLRSSAF
jgi:hypothetical protein